MWHINKQIFPTLFHRYLGEKLACDSYIENLFNRTCENATDLKIVTTAAATTECKSVAPKIRTHANIIKPKTITVNFIRNPISPLDKKTSQTLMALLIFNFP
jgi:hypothetical protein